jgi:hypothetical protein
MSPHSESVAQESRQQPPSQTRLSHSEWREQIGFSPHLPTAGFTHTLLMQMKPDAQSELMVQAFFEPEAG